MSATPAPASRPISLSADAASQGALTALYSAALGHGRKERYLRRFAQFDAAGRTSPGWNGAASLCTLGWAALRQLWVPALLYVAVLEGLALLALGPGRWLLPQQAHLPALVGVCALAWILPGLYGDALLHTEIRQRIVTALTQTASVAEACIFLGQKASTPQRLQKLVLAHVAAGVVAVAAAALAVWQPSGNARHAGAALPSSPAAAGAPGAASATGPEPTVQEALHLSARAVVPAPAAAAAASALPLPVSAAPATPAPAAKPSGLLNAAQAQALPSAALSPAVLASGALATRPPAASATTGPAASATRVPAPALAPPAPSRPASPTPPAPAAGKGAEPAEPGSQPGYYLHAGLFAQEANARKLQARLLNAHLPAFRQSLKTPQGQRIRVRVGPFSTRQQAEAQRRTLRTMDVEAVVLRQ